MTQTTLTIRLEKDLKNQFKAIAKEAGMSMTTAVCLFAQRAVREQRIPFEIGSQKDPFYSQANMRRLRKSIDQLESREGTVHERP